MHLSGPEAQASYLELGGEEGKRRHDRSLAVTEVGNGRNGLRLVEERRAGAGDVVGRGCNGAVDVDPRFARKLPSVCDDEPPKISSK